MTCQPNMGKDCMETKWKLCVTSKILQKTETGDAIPFEEALRFLKAAGFEEIDFGFDSKMLLQEDWISGFEKKLRLCEQMNVRVRYAHLPYNYPKTEEKEAWHDFYRASCRAMDLAHMAGTDCAAIHPRTTMTQAYDPEKEHGQALAFLTLFQEYAQKIGFPLALENMRGPGRSASGAICRYGMETEDVIRLADELGMGICWDTGHGNISGQDQYASLLKIGKRLKMVHINDNEGEDDVHLAPFLGKIDWPQVIKALKEIHYTGSLNLEVHCNKLPDDLRTAYAVYMGCAAKKLQSMMIKEQQINLLY